MHEGSDSLHPHQLLLRPASECSVISHWGLTGISLMTHIVDHLFMCLLATCWPSLEKYPFKSLAHFSIGWLSCYCWVVRALYIFWTPGHYQIWGPSLLLGTLSHSGLSSVSLLLGSPQTTLANGGFPAVCSPLLHFIFFMALIFLVLKWPHLLVCLLSVPALPTESKLCD